MNQSHQSATSRAKKGDILCFLRPWCAEGNQEKDIHRDRTFTASEKHMQGITEKAFDRVAQK